MKKLLILYAIIAFTTINSVFSDESRYSEKYLENRYWQFIKERLLDGNPRFVSSFKEDICIILDNATKPDSIIVKNLCLELNRIFSNRKIFLNPDNILFKPNSIIIRFNEYEKMNSNESPSVLSSANINGNQIMLWGRRKGSSQIFTQNCHIRFNDTISFRERKRYIEYAVVRSLCQIKSNAQYAEVSIKGAIFNDFQFNPQNTSLSNVDKFLLSKLYSNSFEKEFRDYMLSRYSWLYYMNFINSYSMKFIGNTLSIILGMLILLVSYNSVIKRPYRKNYFSYLFPGLLIANSVLLIFSVNSIIQNSFSIYYLNDLVIINPIVVAASTILFFSERYFIKSEMKFSVQLGLKSLFMLVVSLISLYFWFNFSSGFTSIGIIGTLGFALAISRGTHLYFKGINESIIRKKDVELSKLKELKALAEIKSLHARINPHFLYNSLNSIAGLVHSHPANAEKMALSLSDMFRYTINRNGEQFSSVKDEVKMVQTYLEIEQIRFGQRMNFSIDIDKDCEIAQIPKFIIQPLIENAIKHGISKIEDKGEIHLAIHKIDKGLEIIVSDNGPAFPVGLICGYGLQSLFDLLKITYGENAELNWQNDPQKTISVIIKSNLYNEI